MLHFREHKWLLNRGASQITAYVTPARARAGEIMWSLDLQYVAGGSIWRRVSTHQRPAFHLDISGFGKKRIKNWTDIENLSFWHRDEEKNDIFSGGGGMIDATLWNRDGGSGTAREDTPFADAIWRVTRRDGGFFTVEISGLADGRDRLQAALDRLMGVLPDGTLEQADPGPEFWKANSVFYIIETIPFGEATVRVPRNARDPEVYATALMKKLTGAPDPEHVAIHDHARFSPENGDLANDLFVKLQYHGSREA